MYNHSLFQKIISRVAKEYNVQHIVLANYRTNDINNIIEKHKFLINDRVTIKSILYYNSNLFANICYNENIYSVLNSILYKIAYSELKKLLINEKALKKFNKNIKNDNRYIFYVGYNMKRVFNLDLYIQYAKEHFIDILNLLLDSFRWNTSYEGYYYWENINKKYRKIIYKVLFNYDLK